MSIHVTSLEDYYNQYIDAPKKASTLQQKAKVFFNNQGLFKILAITGLAIGIIGAIGCMIQGVNCMDFAHPFGIVNATGTIAFICGLFFTCVHQSYLLKTINPYISNALGKN